MTPYRLTDGVFVPARTAALLSNMLDLDRRRVEWRGSDHELDEVLLAWRQTVVAFTAPLRDRLGCGDGFAAATEDAPTPQPGAQCHQQESLGSSEVADLLDVSGQAVTKAARDGRLDGRQVAGRWVFTPDAVAIYQANRSTTR